MRKAIVGIAVVALASCHARGEHATQQRESPRAARPGTAIDEVTNDAGNAASTVPSAPSLSRAASLMDRLEQERLSRPHGNKRSVEDVVAAIRRAGVVLDEPKQHLGAPIGALYCVGAHTEHDVAISVCEFADEKAALAGRDLSRVAFQKIAHRTVHAEAETTLALLESPPNRESERDVRRTLGAFRQR